MANNKTKETNATKTTRTFDKYDSLFNKLTACKTKHELVDTMLAFGLRTTTKPTDTINMNDLYLQFFDKSRILLTKKSLKLYTCEEEADKLKAEHKDWVFDKVEDGSYRKRRVTLPSNLENFTTLLAHFLTDENNFTPSAE